MKRQAQGTLNGFIAVTSRSQSKGTNSNSLEILKKVKTSEDTNDCILGVMPAVVAEASRGNKQNTSCIGNLESSSYNDETPITQKNDIGAYVSCGKNLVNSEKVILLRDLWIPNSKYPFPVEDNGRFKRRFQIKWLEAFNWLAYSKLKEGSFCKYCVLFYESEYAGKGKHETLGCLVTTPCTNLKKSLEIFAKHQQSNYHKKAVLAAENIISILEKRQDNVLMQMDSKRKADAEKNRAKLAAIVQTIRLCGQQQLPLRGHEDSGRISLEESLKNDGNFRALLRYRANSGDHILKEHLENSSGNAMYTSAAIQNELMANFGDLIQSIVVQRVAKSGYFTILADETTDISQTEQFSLCVRYFDDSELKIREDFLTFVPVTDVSGLALANSIEQTLNKVGFDLDKMRGQGYDGAAAMRGQFRGVQAVIRKKYPKAVYTHCVSHSLNLCLSDATKAQTIRNAFGVISEVCTFFHSSAKRTNVLKNKIQELKPTAKARRLKTVCETRWVLRHEAVFLFKDFLQPIIASLEDIEELNGTDSARKANSLHHAICNFPFLVATYVASRILGMTYILSENLQNKEIDLIEAPNHVGQTISALKTARENVDTTFREIYTEVKNFAELLDITEATPRICGVQRNRSNIASRNAEEYYRITLYVPYLDDIISSLEERFVNQKENIISLQNIVPSNVVSKQFSSITPAIIFYEEDLPGFPDTIKGEWERWQDKWKNIQPEFRPTTAAAALSECNFNMYPNIYELLKIMAVIPVSTASAERSFSTLRRLKSYLRSTMSEHRLVGLALLNIHRDIQISDNAVIDKFAQSHKPRRLDFVI